MSNVRRVESGLAALLAAFMLIFVAPPPMWALWLVIFVVSVRQFARHSRRGD